jgi:hypothetical protein
MEIDVEIKEIKEFLSMLNEKLDLLMGDRESISVMKVAESSLRVFFEGEPALYSYDDTRAV